MPRGCGNTGESEGEGFGVRFSICQVRAMLRARVRMYHHHMGAPIGLLMRRSWVSLRVIMNLCDRKVLDLMENINLVPKVAFWYVDYIQKLFSAIKLDWRWGGRGHAVQEGLGEGGG